ncbi:amidase domain-containing protein [Microbacteriaceae bacterium VKM Ac-2854]|nr:amidase domain-containing protein [Microbacteriaceae bacterium VKM Ac-2854]
MTRGMNPASTARRGTLTIASLLVFALAGCATNAGTDAEGTAPPPATATATPTATPEPSAETPPPEPPAETPTPAPSEPPAPEPTEADPVEPASAGVQAQLAYVLENYDNDFSDEYGFFDANDCANFVSQSLLARGWALDDDWWYSAEEVSGALTDGNGHWYSSSWISATALNEYIASTGATPLTDDERDQVALGDVVLFDFDGSGDRDHSGVVTAVETDAATGATSVSYASHSAAGDYRDVDWTITEQHPGGEAFYFHLVD